MLSPEMAVATATSSTSPVPKPRRSARDLEETVSSSVEKASHRFAVKPAGDAVDVDLDLDAEEGGAEEGADLKLHMILTTYSLSVKGRLANNHDPFVRLDIGPDGFERPASCLTKRPECAKETETRAKKIRRREGEDFLFDRLFFGMRDVFKATGQYLAAHPGLGCMASDMMARKSLLRSISAQNSVLFGNLAACSETSSVAYVKILSYQAEELAEKGRLEFPYIYYVGATGKAHPARPAYDHMFLIVSPVAIPEVDKITSHAGFEKIPAKIRDQLRIVDAYNGEDFLLIPFGPTALNMHSGKFCSKLEFHHLANYQEIQLREKTCPPVATVIKRAMERAESIEELDPERDRARSDAFMTAITEARVQKKSPDPLIKKEFGV